MDATPTPDDPDQTSLGQNSPGAPRLPDDADPDISEESSVSQIIAFGKHALQMAGRNSRAEWEWRRRTYKALHCLRAQGLRGDRDARERLRSLLSKVDFTVVFGATIPGGVDLTVGDWHDSFEP